MENEIRRTAAERGIAITDEYVRNLCAYCQEYANFNVIGLITPHYTTITDYVRPLEFDPSQACAFRSTAIDSSELCRFGEAAPAHDASATEVCNMPANVSRTTTSEASFQAKQSGAQKQAREASYLEAHNSGTKAHDNRQPSDKQWDNGQESLLQRQKMRKQQQNDDRLDDFQFSYDRKTGLTNTAYRQTRQNSLYIYSLMPKNASTIQYKKFRKSDPVSNYRKYQARWDIQGPPDERRQRQWKGKIEDSVGQFLQSNGYM